MHLLYYFQNLFLDWSWFSAKIFFLWEIYVIMFLASPLFNLLKIKLKSYLLLFFLPLSSYNGLPFIPQLVIQFLSVFSGAEKKQLLFHSFCKASSCFLLWSWHMSFLNPWWHFSSCVFALCCKFKRGFPKLPLFPWRDKTNYKNCLFC